VDVVGRERGALPHAVNRRHLGAAQHQPLQHRHYMLRVLLAPAHSTSGPPSSQYKAEIAQGLFADAEQDSAKPATR